MDNNVLFMNQSALQPPTRIECPFCGERVFRDDPQHRFDSSGQPVFCEGSVIRWSADERPGLQVVRLYELAEEGQ